jgi:hypothetical protein
VNANDAKLTEPTNTTKPPAAPGDVLAVWTGSGLIQNMIRVGVVDCTPYLSDSRTMSNHGQPKPNDHGQLTSFLASAAKSLGIAYDWVGIAEDALDACHVEDLSRLINPLWQWPSNHNLLPGHVVCSSLAAMLYDLPSVGWAHPDLGEERECEPADWWQWSQSQAWRHSARTPAHAMT